MARSGVTFTEVDEAARYLQGQNRQPTVDAIRQRLGTGSRTTLAEHLKHWKALQTPGEDKLPSPLLALVTGLWESLQSQAEQRLHAHQLTYDQEITTLKAQLLAAQQMETQLTQQLNQRQEDFVTEQTAKSHLTLEWQKSEKALDKLKALHEVTLKQIEEAKQENQRMHKLAKQMQTNVEHYQQAIQQQQTEQNLAQEKQHTLFMQELSQTKTLLDKIKKDFDHSEKALAASQFQGQQAQKNYDKITQEYQALLAKSKQIEKAFICLQAQEDASKNHQRELRQELASERQLTQSLQEKLAVHQEQLQRAQSDLEKAEDKVTSLRHEKMFLSQEKARLEGAFKQWQVERTGREKKK